MSIGIHIIIMSPIETELIPLGEDRIKTFRYNESILSFWTNNLLILEFYSEYECNQMVSDSVHIPRLFSMPRFYSHRLSCGFEWRVSLVLGKAILLSFLIITPHPYLSVYIFRKNFLWFNKLKKSFPQFFFKHEQMVLFCVFLRELCLLEQGPSYAFNVIQPKNMKNKSGHRVLSLHQHLYPARSLLYNLEAFVWTLDRIRTKRIWAHIPRNKTLKVTLRI